MSAVGGRDCQVLGHRHDVRIGVDTVPAEGSTGSPESRDDLVENQENLMFVADLPYALETAVRRNDHAAGHADGVENHGSKPGCIMQCDDFLELLREFDAPPRFAALKRAFREERVAKAICFHQ